MRIKDIMNKEVMSLSADMSAREALEILEKKQISGLPVIDNEGKLLGMFTEKNILAHILPSYVETVGKFVYDQDPKATKKKLSQLKDFKVSHLMRKDVVTTDPDASLSEVARRMLVEKARRVPVVDKSGKVVGIVARCDVLRAIMKEAEETK